MAGYVEARFLRIPQQQLPPIGGDHTIQNAGLRFNGNPQRRNSTDRIIIHHTVTHTNGAQGIQAIHAAHIRRGFVGIGYHYVIDQNGVIWRGRPNRNDVGAHTVGQRQNFYSIGIGLIGNFHINGNLATDAQLSSLQWLIRDIRRTHGELELGYHGQFEPNACPGRYFLAYQWPMLAQWHRPLSTFAAASAVMQTQFDLLGLAAAPFMEDVFFDEASMIANMPELLPPGAGFVSVLSNDWSWGDIVASYNSDDIVWAGTQVSITAEAGAGFEFVRWEIVAGNAVIANPFSRETNVISASGHAIVRAIFQEASAIPIIQVPPPPAINDPVIPPSNNESPPPPVAFTHQMQAHGAAMLLVRGGSTLVQARAFTDEFGGTISASSGVVTATGTSRGSGEPVTIVMTVGSPIATINGVATDIATFVGQPSLAGQIAPITESGRTYVPVRFLANAFGIPFRSISGGVEFN